MPYIVKLNTLDVPAGTGFADAVSRFGQRLPEMMRQRREDERRAAERERDLDIEEQKAAAALLREQSRGMPSLAEQASMSGVMEGAARDQATAGSEAFGQGMGEALNSPGGMLGPFGLAQSAAQGSAKLAASQARWETRKQLASRMKPDTARGYLQREADRDKQELYATDYEKESQEIQKALADGVFDPATGPDGQPAKPGEPSDVAVKTAAELTKGLQGDLREGKPPGAARERLAKFRRIHAQQAVRAQSWVKADEKAADLLAAVGDLFNQLGPEARAGVDGKLAKAASEWELTKSQTFRGENDPDDQLAALQGILFGMQEAESTQLPMRSPPQPDAFATSLAEDRNQLDLAAIGESEAPRQRMAGPGPSQTQPGPRQDPGPAAKGGTSAKRDPEELVRGYVRDNAATLFKGGATPEKIRKLREKIADDLGVDPYSASATSILKDELDRVFGKTGRGGK